MVTRVTRRKIDGKCILLRKQLLGQSDVNYGKRCTVSGNTFVVHNQFEFLEFFLINLKVE